MDELRNKMNIDFENRKRDLKTYPFEKQCDLAKACPEAVVNHAECFYLSADYYPEETRGKLDVENISVLGTAIAQTMENHQANMTAEPTLVEREDVSPEMMVEQPAQKTL